MYTHNLDPILLDFGFLAIRWYSLAYILGIVIGWWYGKKIITHILKKFDLKFHVKEFDDLITYIIISIIIGGRLGYVFFYNLEFYISNPLDVVKIWEGGMSFHGGLIGIIFGTYLFSSKRKIPTFFLLDIIACVSPIGIFFGRIANFINGELFGKVTTVSWGVVFPAIDMLPRHPSQLYEAFFEGIILFILLNLIYKKYINHKPGVLSALFLIFYSVFRFIIEFTREPDAHLGLVFMELSQGQVMSILFFVLGLIILKIKNA